MTKHDLQMMVFAERDENDRIKALNAEMLAALELAETLEARDVDPSDTRWKDARKMRRAAIAKARQS